MSVLSMKIPCFKQYSLNVKLLYYEAGHISFDLRATLYLLRHPLCCARTEQISKQQKQPLCKSASTPETCRACVHMTYQMNWYVAFSGPTPKASRTLNIILYKLWTICCTLCSHQPLWRHSFLWHRPMQLTFPVLHIFKQWCLFCILPFDFHIGLLPSISCLYMLHTLLLKKQKL